MEEPRKITNTSARIAGLLPEIRTRDLLNTKKEYNGTVKKELSSFYYHHQQ
jgi:hypothetical protein